MHFCHSGLYVSDILLYSYHIVRYRRKVVKNLTNSFPENQNEIVKLRNSFIIIFAIIFRNY